MRTISDITHRGVESIGYRGNRGIQSTYVVGGGGGKLILENFFGTGKTERNMEYLNMYNIIFVPI